MIIIERIKELIARKEMSETSFAKLIGVSQRTLNNYMNGRTPSLEVLDAILSVFPEVSSEWLLRGEGKMLKSDINENKTSPINVDGDFKTIEMEKKIKRLEVAMDALIEKNERLEAELAEYKAKEALGKESA